jgi:glucans biosynthesis protein
MADNLPDQSGDSGGNPFDQLPRCGAKTRHGGTCGRIGNARNGRCHLHGGWAGAPRGERNGRWRGGFYTQEAQAERRRLHELIRQMRTMMDELP